MPAMSGRTRRVLVYPELSVGNRYLSTNAALWRGLGLEVVDDWRPAALLRMRWRDTAVVLNWFEDWLPVGNRVTAALRTLRAVLLLLGCRLAARRLVYVRHNYVPHGPTMSKTGSRLLRRLLVALADDVVTHRPVDDVPGRVVPHCLVGAESPQRTRRERTIEFVWFGVIARYKALDELLRHWPADRPLLIAGHCQDGALSDEIRRVIAERALRVQWDNRPLADDELDTLLSRSRWVVLSHVDRSMIVSGAFFHAASFGVNVLFRDGEFARWAAARHRFVSTFDWPTLAQAIGTAHAVDPPAIVDEAQAHYGAAACADAWRRVLCDPR